MVRVNHEARPLTGSYPPTTVFEASPSHPSRPGHQQSFFPQLRKTPGLYVVEYVISVRAMASTDRPPSMLMNTSRGASISCLIVSASTQACIEFSSARPDVYR
ncbi:hypothetical protein LshimejAT787_0605680 [Lyophyllum shimeji]|uniref:Uncharacterized protein n=1 Tax=Lyophyllum shimeji TaxID=47721 RepID=A0A9P3PQ92_LYOSH|nr:hypothetical protein LshimejAT787_0605680 [Lyophyllum shimeji]